MVSVLQSASVVARNCVKLMELTSSSLNVSFVAQSLSGSVGVIPISVRYATSGNVVEITSQGKPEISCPSVQERVALVREIIHPMAKSMRSAAVFAETYPKTKKISEIKNKPIIK